MCALGNARVNAIYEYEIPDHVKKPTSSSSRSVGMRWLATSNRVWRLDGDFSLAGVRLSVGEEALGVPGGGVEKM